MTLQEPLLDTSVDDAIIRERNKDVQALVGDMVGLQEAMKDINEIVDKQGEHLQVIEKNTEQADVLVEDGTHDVEMASDYAQSARKKICIIVLIVVVVLAVIGIVVAYLLGAFNHPASPASTPTPAPIPSPTVAPSPASTAPSS